MQTEISEIESVIQLYFDGLYYGDTAKLEQAFHMTCHMYHVEEGGRLVDELVASTLPWKPAASGWPREDGVISIDLSGPSTAFVKVRCAKPPRFYIDYLTLAKLKEGWRIVSKTYRTEIREKTPTP